jgi:tRNA dimethylallyltransferase
MKFPYNLIVILGPTASGKTKLAASISNSLHAEIISADSRQVYRDMNIGTGKDYADYTINRTTIKHHLIDIVEAGAHYHLHQYMQDFTTVYQSIRNQNKIPVLCGGTGLYIDAVLKGYEYASVPINEELRNSLKEKSHEELIHLFKSLTATNYTPLADISTVKRTIRAIEICSYLLQNKHSITPKFVIKPIVFGLNPDVNIRRKKIEERLELRLQNGLIEEVQTLLNKGVSGDKLFFYGLEYKFVMQYLKGELSIEELKAKLTIAIQQFAKRQMTFFRKMERDGLTIHWIDGSLSLKEQSDYLLKTLNINY